MKKLSKIAQVTFFAAAFAVLFSGTADAYIDPSVMNYAIQAVAGVIIAVGAAAGIYWRKAKKKIDKSLGIDENRREQYQDMLNGITPMPLELFLHLLFRFLHRL